MNDQDTLHGLFEAQATRNPDHLAVICGHQTITYDELNKRSNQLARYLQKQGVGTETHVALCMERSIELMISLLAILKAGGAYVPLDPSHPLDRLTFILNDIQAPVVLTQSKFRNKLPHDKGKLIVPFARSPLFKNESMRGLKRARSGNQLAYIIYTSGSTGTPKGVLIEHQSVVNYSRWFIDYLNCQPLQRMDFSSNIIFDMAVTSSIVSLTAGLTLVVCGDIVKKNISSYLKHLDEHHIQFIKVTPSYFKAMLLEVQQRPISLTHLEGIILGGEALSSADCAAWLALYPAHTLINEYGPTEATVAVTQYQICRKNLSTLGLQVPIGRPGPQMECFILDKKLKRVKPQESGELYIGGLCLARGYLNQPKLTQSHFIKHPFSKQKQAKLYKTGDICQLSAEGIYKYKGRIDDQLKIRGFRVEPAEVEKCLSEHPDILRAAVLPREVQGQEKRLMAYYVLKDIKRIPSEKQLRRYLSATLPDYMIPSGFVKMDAFPLTANGKLDTASLPISHYVTNQHFVTPTTALEKKISKIWSEELHVNPIGLNDDFFELGGHSLAAARVVSRMNHALKTELNLKDFYASPTIAQIVNHIPTRLVHHVKLKKDLRHLPLTHFQLMLWLSNTFEPKAKKLNIISRKRLKGQPHLHALTFAFEALIKKHDVLSFRVLRMRPFQGIRKKKPFILTERQLEHLPIQTAERVLADSIQALNALYPWRPNEPMIIAKLFYLEENQTELQISMPHIISDDLSTEILYEDLSKFYFLYFKDRSASLSLDFEGEDGINIKKSVLGLNGENKFSDYVVKEQHKSIENTKADEQFWKNYLKQTHAFSFPKDQVIKNMEAQGMPYSTFIEIPEHLLTLFKAFCAAHQVSMHDGLCAAVTMALFDVCGYIESKPIYINMIQSSRDSKQYDKAIGCFLRIAPIKLRKTKEDTLVTLSQRVHLAVMDTNPYQHAPDLLKLACIHEFRQIAHPLLLLPIHLLIAVYTTVFRVPVHARKLFRLCGHLFLLNRSNKYIININVHPHFTQNTKRKHKKRIFGLNTLSIDTHQLDLLDINDVFEACFLRMGHTQTPYLAMSANLRPDFRERIAKAVIQIIHTQTASLSVGTQ